MPNFSAETVNEICRRCEIPENHWEWLNGEQSRSTGAGQRLRLFAEGTRNDAKNMLSEKRVQCFLYAIRRENLYPAWRQWLIDNSKHEIVRERLPPAGDFKP